jgi:hypothetical protein
MQRQYGRRQSSLDFEIVRLPARASVPTSPADVPVGRAPPSYQPSVRAQAALHRVGVPTSYTLPASNPLPAPPPPRLAPAGEHDEHETAYDDHADVPVGSGLDISTIMREQCVCLVCQRCQHGIVEKFLDSTSADSICAMLEAHDTFGRCGCLTRALAPTSCCTLAPAICLTMPKVGTQ